MPKQSLKTSFLGSVATRTICACGDGDSTAPAPANNPKPSGPQTRQDKQ
jgi:hypothetical protein